MVGLILRRLVLIPMALLLVNFFGFAYGHLIGGNGTMASLSSEYRTYLVGLSRLDFGPMPYAGGTETLGSYLARASGASFGLLLLAFVLSICFGIGLGMRSVRSEPPRVATWMTVLGTLGLAMPGFFIGSLILAGALAYLIWGPTRLPVPIGGFGWDAHVILPTLVLLVRPTAQIAQVTSGMLVGELGKQYVVAARSLGHSWGRIFRRYAWRNVLAAVFIAIAGSLRLLIGELIIVERIFNWPGIGLLVAQILVPARLSNAADSVQFLHPPLLAAVLTLFTAVFLLADFVATALAASIDPRIRASS
jgi:peptide/nickel transport system permease protein